MLNEATIVLLVAIVLGLIVLLVSSRRYGPDSSRMIKITAGYFFRVTLILFLASFWREEHFVGYIVASAISLMVGSIIGLTWFPAREQELRQNQNENE